MNKGITMLKIKEYTLSAKSQQTKEVEDNVPTDC